MKHIDRRHFYVRETVEEGLIRVPYVATADNMADLFTKPLPARVFFPMRDRIMNYMPLRHECSEHGGQLKSDQQGAEGDTHPPHSTPSGAAHEASAIPLSYPLPHAYDSVHSKSS